MRSVFEESPASSCCIRRPASLGPLRRKRPPAVTQDDDREVTQVARPSKLAQSPAEKSSRVFPSSRAVGGGGADSLGESTSTSPSMSERVFARVEEGIESSGRVADENHGAIQVRGWRMSACTSSTFCSSVPQRQARMSLRPTPALSNAQKRICRTCLRTSAQASVGMPSPLSASTTGPVPLQEIQSRTFGSTRTRFARGPETLRAPCDEQPARKRMQSAAPAPFASGLATPRTLRSSPSSLAARSLEGAPSLLPTAIVVMKGAPVCGETAPR